MTVGITIIIGNAITAGITIIIGNTITAGVTIIIGNTSLLVVLSLQTALTYYTASYVVSSTHRRCSYLLNKKYALLLLKKKLG